MSNYTDTSINNSRNAIDTGRAAISFGTSNLLDDQIMLAVKKCIESNHVNHVKFLQHLEAIGNGTIKL